MLVVEVHSNLLLCVGISMFVVEVFANRKQNKAFQLLDFIIISRLIYNILL